MMTPLYRYYFTGVVPVTLVRRKLFKKNEYKVQAKLYKCGWAVFATNEEDAWQEFRRQVIQQVDRNYAEDGLEVDWNVLHDTDWLLAGNLNEHYKRTLSVKTGTVYDIELLNVESMTLGQMFSIVSQTRLKEIYGEDFTIKFDKQRED